MIFNILTAILFFIIIILFVLNIYFFVNYKKLKKELNILSGKSLFLNDNELKYLEFTVDMYIRYSHELDIHSKEQHEFIINELERIRNEKLLPKIKNDQ